MQIGILGPFEVRTDNGALADVPGARLRALLVALALGPGRVVPKSILIDWIWGENPPPGAANALQRLASRLRKVLPEGSIAREGDKAYVWRVAGGKLHKVPVTLGERDARRGEFVITSGIATGDQLLRTPGSALTDGQRVDLVKPVAGAASAASGA